jgi:DNA-binding transcriptional regulator YiaG
MQICMQFFLTFFDHRPIIARGEFTMPAQTRKKAAAISQQAKRVIGLRAGLGVSRKLFSRLTGYSERAIADWEAGKELSESSRQRIAEMERLQKALARVMKAEHISQWLQEPNKAFGGLKPVEVVERGEVDRIWRMIYELESGAPG